MLTLNKNAKCNNCAIQLRVEQPNKGTEKGEKWVCKSYPKGIPVDIVVNEGNCPYFEED